MVNGSFITMDDKALAEINGGGWLTSTLIVVSAVALCVTFPAAAPLALTAARAITVARTVSGVAGVGAVVSSASGR